jgi:porphobilinogen synthase
MFPQQRMRRTRTTPAMRALVRENRLSAEQLVQPLFVDETIGERRMVASLPGQCALPVGEVLEECLELQKAGVGAVLLFGIPAVKDPFGKQAYAADGVVQRTVREIKRGCDITVITDLCLCEYTDHGHCGVLLDGYVDNDPTLDLYCRTAVSQADAGADMVAPSGMMDGQVAAIRDALDRERHSKVGILAYSAKFASSFYGPFRDMVGSAPSKGDRRSHQMDPANGRQALLEMQLDADEGADVLMVKPAMPYLDVIKEARQRFDLPLCAYQVSGEYAMIKACQEKGSLDGERAMMESLLCIRRAGADMIITYFAKEAAELLRCENVH